jgi:nucleolar complex protein 3
MKKPHDKKRQRTIEKPKEKHVNAPKLKKDAEKEDTSHVRSSDPEDVTATCDAIAELCESILEDPHHAFSSANDDEASKKQRTNVSKMDQLFRYASRVTQTGHGTKIEASSASCHVAQLALLSLVAIYKDILPSYRIRVPTEQEMAVKVSKEVQQLWNYERTLLQHYQQFLMLLEKTWEQHHRSSNAMEADRRLQESRASLAVSAILCLAELLKSAFHFNFRSNLLTAVIRQMNHASSDVIRQACCQAIEYIFIHDAQGEVTLEAARQVAKLMKDRAYKVQVDVLRTFSAIPLRVHADEAVAAQLASQAQSKKRKADRELAAIEEEMKEGHTTVDKMVLARCQSDTLQAVILTYFRILKSENLSAKHVQELLPGTLEGLAKFAHLINIDTVVDLLGVLRDLLKKIDALPVDAALNCILTAFQTLQGPGKEMKIDPKEYIMPLYNQIPRICSVAASEKYTDLLLQCLTMAFIKRREYSNVRVAAFVKRMLSAALHTPPHTSVPLLALVRQFLQRYPNAEQLLENESDVITEGQYLPEVDDPEHANPFATSGWELAALQFHYHGDVVAQASAAATAKLLSLPAEQPEKLRSIALRNMEDLYIPFVRIQKRHPLYVKVSSNEKQKKRNQVRFITPRTQTCNLTM